MSKDDHEAYTPGDPERNEELIIEIRKRERKSKALALAKALGREDILSISTEPLISRSNSVAAAEPLDQSIEIASCSDQGGSTSRPHLPAKVHRDGSKRRAFGSEYTISSKKHCLDSSKRDLQPEARVIPNAAKQDSHAEDSGQSSKRRAAGSGRGKSEKKRCLESPNADLHSEARRNSCSEDSESKEESNCEIERHESEGKNKYAANSGLKHTLHGNIYQLKLLMLFVKRGLQQGYNFRLATEMDAAEKFDDVVFRYADKAGSGTTVCRYLQAKHRQDESKTITTSDLLNKEEGDFSLLKYFVAYRKIKKHPELKRSKFEDYILCTNIDFDLSDKADRKHEQAKFRVHRDKERALRSEDLTVSEIGLEEVGGFDVILDVKNSSKQSARYKIVVNDRHDLHETLGESSDAYLLAKTLAKHVFSKTKMTLRTEIFKFYHIALATHVIDVENKRIFTTFSNNDETLSPEVRTFRKIFGAELLKLMRSRDPNASEEAMKAKIQEEKLELSEYFGQKFKSKESSLTNLKEFSEAFVTLIRKARNDNLIVIDRQLYKRNAEETDKKIIGVNIDKLAKCALIVDGKKIQFDPKFFTNSELSDNMQAFKNELKTLLKEEYKDLKKYRFEVKNSPKHWDLLYATSELPDDEVKIEEISEFFKQLTFAVRQPNEVELGRIIQTEIGEDSRFNVLSADLVSNSFEIEMLDWFKEKGKGKGKEGKFFTSKKGTAFFKSMEKKINDLMCSGLSWSYPEELEEYGIEFEDENQQLKNFLNNEEAQVLNLISAGKTLPTAIRVHKTIRKQERYKNDYSLIFMRLRSLRPEKTRQLVIRSFESPKRYDLLIIDCESLNNDDLHILDEIYKQLCIVTEKEENSAKKLIFITQEMEESSGIKSNATFQNCEKKTDKVTFNHLCIPSQKKLLEKEVINLQGLRERPISLLNLLGISEVSRDLRDFTDAIDSTTLVKLICGGQITLGNGLNTLGEIEDFFIPRTFNQQVLLREDILKSRKESDVFATSGIEKKELEELVTDPNKIKFFNEIDRRTAPLYKFIILSSDSHVATDQFRAVCENYSSDKHNVHWIERKSKKLIWKESRGNIGNLIAYRESTRINNDDHKLDKTTAKCPDEDQLVEGDRVVIICDTAGMGKTTVLTHLASKIMQNPSGTWVIRVDLNDCTRELKEQEEKKELTERKFFIEKLSKLKTDLEKRILRTIIKNCGRVAVLFDGFDEIRSEFREIVIDVLQALKNSTGVTKLFVSSRPHTSEALEKQLGSFSYAMEPFSEENQIEFLIKFWTQRLGLKDAEERTKERLKMYAETVIHKVAKSIDDQAKKFTGIPLQTRMLADIFESQSHQREKEHRDFQTCQEFLDSENNEPTLPENINIINLYDRFVNRKLDIYVEEKMKMAREIQGVEETLEYFTQKFNETHEVLALRTLFKTEDLKVVANDLKTIKSINQCREDEEHKGKEPIGFIIRIIDGEPQFIHRSYAEYFAANFFIRKLLVTQDPHIPPNPEVIKLLLDVLFQPNYNIIRAFVNGLLLKNYSSPPHQRYEDNPFADGSFKSALAKTNDKSRKNILHVTVNERHTGILKYILNQLSELDGTWHQLITGVPHKWEFDPTRGSFMSSYTPIGLAGSLKYWVGLKMLLEHDIARVGDSDNEGGTPLHYAAAKGDLKMVQWLVEKGADLHAIDGEKKTPLHHAAVGGSLEMVQWLVEKGADLHAIDGEKKTPLHYATWMNKLEMVQWLVEKGADLHAIDGEKQTPLHYATWMNKLEMVQWLVEKGADLHAIDRQKKTPLHHAAWRGSLEMVQWLVEKGADLHAIDGEKQTPLHYATWMNKLEMVQWLVEKGADLHAIDRKEKTPLHYAAWMNKLEMVQWLVEKGADLHAIDGEKKTPLHHAAVGGSLEMVQWLVEKGADLHAIDGEKQTPLHHAAWRGSLEMVQWLVEKGADLHAIDGEKQTPLHYATWMNKLEMVQWLVEKGADLHAIDGEKKTPLHYAARTNNSEMVQWLLQKGANPNALDSDNKTPMHYNDPHSNVVKSLRQ